LLLHVGILFQVHNIEIQSKFQFVYWNLKCYTSIRDARIPLGQGKSNEKSLSLSFCDPVGPLGIIYKFYVQL
jgi:hypothetical protein